MFLSEKDKDLLIQDREKSLNALLNFREMLKEYKIDQGIVQIYMVMVGEKDELGLYIDISNIITTEKFPFVRVIYLPPFLNPLVKEQRMI